jgi:uncharacterized SAM-binding protein YcdF (DUF218 family)
VTGTDDRYYLLPRRLIHAALATFVLSAMLLGAAAFVLSEQWLPRVSQMLDAEAPLASPDVVVLRASGRARAADRAAAELVAAGAKNVVLLGRPFAPDDLSPAERSRRHGSLTAAGVPPARIVELYENIDLWEALDDVAAAAHDRGWRRVLFISSPGANLRTLLGARSVLGGQGLEVGLVSYPGDDEGIEPLWWTDAQLRGHVLYNWILLLFGRLVGRY